MITSVLRTNNRERLTIDHCLSRYPHSSRSDRPCTRVVSLKIVVSEGSDGLLLESNGLKPAVLYRFFFQIGIVKNNVPTGVSCCKCETTYTDNWPAFVQYVFNASLKRLGGVGEGGGGGEHACTVFDGDRRVVSTTFASCIILTGQPPETGVLSKVFLANVPADECNKTYFSIDRPALKMGILADSMICAGSTHDGEDACSVRPTLVDRGPTHVVIAFQGFGGGPLQTMTEPDVQFVQVGITSFGFSKCGDQHKPGVYTRVSKYAEWIEQTVWPDAHRSQPRKQQ